MFLSLTRLPVHKWLAAWALLALFAVPEVAQANFLMRLSAIKDPFALLLRPRASDSGEYNSYSLPQRRGVLDYIRPASEGPLLLWDNYDGTFSNDTQLESNFDAQNATIYSDYALDDNLSLNAIHIILPIESGDTIARTLIRAGLSDKEAQASMNALGQVFKLENVKAGWEIDLVYRPQSSNSTEPQLEFFEMHASKDSKYRVSYVDNELKAEEIKLELSKHHVTQTITIKNGLYLDAPLLNVPDTIVANTTRLFSYAIDFSRDIKEGDKVEILYEEFRDKSGRLVHTGNILFARVEAKGKENSLYRFQRSNGGVSYFTKDAKNPRSKQSFLTKPVESGRKSSPFGMRKHPITGVHTLHAGLDYAASTGTKIYAAADGKITYRARKGSYGNLVEIRHDSTYSTRYAHMSKFKSGLAVGSEVKKGDVIGYVGTTGRSTGPHLHFELIKSGKPINPLSSTLPTGQFLEGQDKKQFVNTMKVVDSLREKAGPPAITVAENQ